MEIIQHEKEKQNVLLTGDYCPNQALINEFQTIFFTCKVTKIELPGKELKDFVVEEQAQFLMLHVRIKNITNEILNMYKDDFMITFDEEGPFEAEDYFGVEDQLPDVIELNEDETAEGCLIFLIPHGAAQLLFTYSEYADDDDPGKTYRLRYVLK
mgnify:CR=1 FL=1